MSQNFQRGDFVSVAWIPLQARAGGGVAQPQQALAAAFTFGIKSHSLKLSALLIDVSNSLSGGLRARLTGIGDIAGNLSLSLDLDTAPFLVNNINIAGGLLMPGQPGIASFGVTPIRGIQVPVSVEECGPASAVDKEVTWDTSMKGNSLAGVVVFPPIP